MKLLVTILAVLLLMPIVLLVGIALGPAILVMVFIAGIGLLTAGLAWALDRARPR